MSGAKIGKIITDYQPKNNIPRAMKASIILYSYFSPMTDLKIYTSYAAVHGICIDIYKFHHWFKIYQKDTLPE